MFLDDGGKVLISHSRFAMFSLFSFQLGKENERDRDSRLWESPIGEGKRLFLSSKQRAPIDGSATIDGDRVR